MAYAFIDEVWGSSTKAKTGSKKQTVKQDPTCTLYKRRDGKDRPLDDIMNAYIDEAPYDKYERASSEMHRMKKRERNLKTVDIKPPKSDYDVSDEFVNEEGLRDSSCYNAEEMIGAYGSTLLDNMYEYDKYYSDNIIRDEQMHDENNACIDDSRADEEMISKTSFKKDDIYNDMTIEKYVNALVSRTHPPPDQTSATKMYLDLVLYVGSGVLLIFLLEQILQLGMLMR